MLNCTEHFKNSLLGRKFGRNQVTGYPLNFVTPKICYAYEAEKIKIIFCPIFKSKSGLAPCYYLANDTTPDA